MYKAVWKIVNIINIYTCLFILENGDNNKKQRKMFF